MSGLDKQLRKAMRRIDAARPRPAGRRGAAIGKTGSIWPYASDALGVNPSQIKEAARCAREAGAPTEFTPDGRAIITSQRHFRELSRAAGLFTGRDGYSAASRESGFTAAEAVRDALDGL